MKAWFILPCISVLLWCVYCQNPACSGNGYQYKEDVALGATEACECLQCFTGSNCSTVDESCMLDSQLVDESGYAAWFRKNGQETIIKMGSTYHMNYLAAPSYLESGTKERITDILENAIFNLHQKVGHGDLKAQGYQIVTSAGALQGLSSLIYTLGVREGIQVFCKAPYFDKFPDIANMIGNTSFTQETNLQAENVIEFVTHPNNPDGQYYPPSYPDATLIYDYVYAFPHISTIAPEMKPIMVFSLSKLAGFAASRFGWVMVKDKALALQMAKYIFLNGQGAGIESKYHATRIIQAIADSVGQQNDFFAFSRNIIAKRWTILQNTFKGSKQYKLNTVPGMPYAWVTCTGTANCVKDFASVNVHVGAGSLFGTNDKNNVRIVIMQEQATFKLLMARIAKLVKAELVESNKLNVSDSHLLHV